MDSNNIDSDAIAEIQLTNSAYSQLQEINCRKQQYTGLVVNNFGLSELCNVSCGV